MKGEQERGRKEKKGAAEKDETMRERRPSERKSRGRTLNQMRVEEVI